MALLWQTHEAFLAARTIRTVQIRILRALEKGRLERMILAGNRYRLFRITRQGLDGKSGQIANAAYIATVGHRDKSQLT